MLDCKDGLWAIGLVQASLVPNQHDSRSLQEKACKIDARALVADLHDSQSPPEKA